MEKIQRYETVIVGAGQAGLSVGYHLKKQGRSFVILDGSERIGDSWRKRWDSLRLYSPAFRDALPGMAFPAPKSAYPTKDEMGDYLEAYAKRFELPVHNGAVVDTLTKENDRYSGVTTDRRFVGDNVIIATGVFRKPFTPEFAGGLDPGSPSSTPTTTATSRSSRKGRCSSSAQATRAPTSPTRPLRHTIVLSGTDTGQLPVPIESRRGRIGFRVLVFAGTHILNVKTPMGRKMRPHIRHGGGPLLRYRKKELLAAGVERVVGQDDRRRARPAGARRRSRPRRAQRRLVHRLPARLRLDPRPDRVRRRRLSGAVPRRRRLVTRPLLRGAPLPALVRVDARSRAARGTPGTLRGRSCKLAGRS